MEKTTLPLLILALMVSGCMSDTQTGDIPTATEPTVEKSNPATTSGITTTTTFREEDEDVPPTIPIRLPANITNCLTLDNTTLRDVCFYDAAGRAKDIVTCDNITSKNMQLKCRAHLEDNSDYCEQIDTLSEKDWCYRMIAFKWNKMKYCNMIFYQKIKDECILDYVIDKKPDPYQCFLIVNADMRDTCIYHHIDLYNKTGAGIKPTLCGLINNLTVQIRCNQTFLNQKF